MADPVAHPAPAEAVSAGDLGAWLDAFPATVTGEQDADVPCGSCTGCCRSSQFIAIGPDEVDALRHIPAALRFPAPGRPKGHVLLGYDERGHCPMLVDGACTIYAHRPRTCRTYDCRVFPAAGLEPDEPTKAAILERVRRWRFSHDGPGGAVRHEAVRAAGRFIADAARTGPAGSVPSTATHQAVLATEIHERFLATDPATGELRLVDPDPAEVRAAIDAHRP
ncbi:MAG TPA: YkgJ family cysteine cluster protein [Acidimicrobiales bacterium]|nr:YkgJ family cysteine cluster protein [Acidimicrobiales bacterium]